jgi:hypothetical protein
VDGEPSLATEGAKRVHVALTTTAEAVIVSDHQLLHAKAVPKDLVHELFGTERS